MIRSVIAHYTTNDGMRFDTPEEAERYALSQLRSAIEEHYMETSRGGLLSDHLLRNLLPNRQAAEKMKAIFDHWVSNDPKET